MKKTNPYANIVLSDMLTEKEVESLGGDCESCEVYRQLEKYVYYIKIICGSIRCCEELELLKYKLYK